MNLKGTIQIKDSDITIDVDKGVNLAMLLHHIHNLAAGFKGNLVPKAKLKMNDDFSISLTYNEKPVIEPGKPAVIKLFFIEDGFGPQADIKTGGETATSIYNALYSLEITYTKQIMEAAKVMWFGDENQASKWSANIINHGL